MQRRIDLVPVQMKQPPGSQVSNCSGKQLRFGVFSEPGKEGDWCAF
jgi:hypothetical protein